MSNFIFIILPVIVVGILAVLLINRVNKKYKNRNILEDENINKNEESSEDNYMAKGMSLGICFGVSIGSIFTNTFGPEAISYGICFGMLGGMIIGMTIKKKWCGKLIERMSKKTGSASCLFYWS